MNSRIPTFSMQGAVLFGAAENIANDVELRVASIRHVVKCMFLAFDKSAGPSFI